MVQGVFDTNGRVKTSWPVVFQVVLYVVTLTLAYSALDKRINSLEVRYDRLQQDIQELKSDVKLLLQRVPPR